MDSESVFRRSLRRINPFRNRIFRLPATPRLSRSKKVAAGCEDVTGWNFERTISLRDRMENGTKKGFQENNGNLSRTSSCGNDFVTTSEMCDPQRQMKSPPPDPVQAESSIAQHMHSLLLTTRERRERSREKEVDRSNRFLQLPLTKYSADGQISTATWDRDSTASPNLSTISLLNTNSHQRTHSIRSFAGSSSLFRSPSLRTTYPINGLFNNTSTLQVKDKSFPRLTVSPLFSLNDFYSDSQLEEPFLGREWVFRDIYQCSVVEKCPVVSLEGVRGAGKSMIANQIILHSPFYNKQGSDTMDSGCVVEGSRNYEWLRAVSARLVAYHVCSLQDASSCSIPEFVCNLGSTLARSPVLRSYAEILEKNPSIQRMLQLEICLEEGPLKAFKTAICEPLNQLASSDQGCLVILIDGLDEAEFHRSEAGESIARFLASILQFVPDWIRFVITSDSDCPTVIEGFPSRTIRIDDSQLDERVVRDVRMLAEFKIGNCKHLEENLRSLRRNNSVDPLSEFLDRIVAQSCGNLLYVSLLLSLAESDLIRLKVLSAALLPTDLDELYLLYFNLTFSTQAVFDRCSPLITVLLASLRPLSISDLSSIFSLSQHDEVTNEEVANRYSVISPFLSFSSKGTLSLHHSAFREWLLRNHGQCKYNIDPREGHLLLAIQLTRKRNLESEELLELAHHLLKANPYKYFPNKSIPELLISKDCQVTWLEYAAKNIGNSLINRRNLLYPNTKVTRLLLLSGASPNATLPPPSSLSLLSLASSAGDPSLVATLLQYDAQVNPTTGNLPVVCAASNGHLDIVQLLHHHGALQGQAAANAIEVAAAGGHVHTVSFLLECDWHDPEAKQKAKQMALERAAENGSVHVCEYLLDGCEPCSLSLSSAMRSACLAGRADTVQFLMSRGAPLSSLGWPSGQSALCCAVESGSWDLVVAVLSQPDSDINWADTEGETAMIKAARKGHVGLLDLLINRESNIDHTDNKGWSGIMHAVYNNHFSCVQLLLDRGAKVDGVDKEDGNTVVHLACANASRQLIDRLLEGGVSIEEKNTVGDRPIEVAIRNSNSGAVSSLLRRGARLRSATWNTARTHHPDTLIVLLNKLLDDAALLYRKRRTEDALHRLQYALQKCESLLEDPELTSRHLQMRKMKMQILLATARTKRRCGLLPESIRLCAEAALLAESDAALFEVVLFRAKCHFDNHDIERSRADARAALQLRPNDEEAKHLLSTLTLPPTNICRL